MTDKKVVAIITARGGSKGLPRKNILNINGIPMIAYTIMAAKESGVFDSVVVTTDDSEIKQVSINYGVEVIDRPTELATDNSSSLDAISHALEVLELSGRYFDYFFLLQPTSVLRTAQHIRDSWLGFEERGFSGSMVSVVEAEHLPQKMLVESNGSIQPLFDWKYLTMPRQIFPTVYRLNGAIYCTNTTVFQRNQNLFEQPIFIYPMDRQSSIDIDNADDVNEVLRVLAREENHGLDK